MANHLLQAPPIAPFDIDDSNKIGTSGVTRNFLRGGQDLRFSDNGRGHVGEAT